MAVEFSIDQTKCGITTIVVLNKAGVQHLICSRSLGKEKKIYGEHSQISKYR